MGNNNLNILASNNNDEINKLKNELTKANKVIEQQKLTINELQNKLNNYNNTINNLNNDIMCVQFISSDQNVHYAATCLKTNTFAEVEEKLYKQYPQYRETNNTFLANGMQVLRFKTIAENKIGNGYPVTLIVPN